MRRKWWQSGLGIGVVAVLVVVSVNLAADWLTREPPNYSRIEDGLYLGGFVPEPPAGVQAVLNLCETKDRYQVGNHRWEPITDAEPAPSLAGLREQVRFIEEQREAGRAVFVHCRNGISRSGMVVVAHLMVRHGSCREEALTFVRSRRPLVRPNPAFIPLLQEWEQSLK